MKLCEMSISFSFVQYPSGTNVLILFYDRSRIYKFLKLLKLVTCLIRLSWALIYRNSLNSSLNVRSSTMFSLMSRRYIFGQIAESMLMPLSVFFDKSRILIFAIHSKGLYVISFMLPFISVIFDDPVRFICSISGMVL